MSKILDQYQAACLIGISPELLKYFVQRTVKKGDSRKLKAARSDGNFLFFDEHELRAYNDWLFMPWPAEGKNRPHLPDAIRNEVRAEAAGECAVCSKHGNSCEAAHIAPVSTTKCNHPHNLLWLCANHHTKFDNGSLGPKGVGNELVKATKLVLQHARKHVWQQAADVSTQIAALLKLAKETTLQLQNATTHTDAKVAESIGNKVLKLLSEITVNNKAQGPTTVLSKISTALEKPATSSGEVEVTTADRLNIVASFEEEFLDEAGLKSCPLCQGTSWHNEQECPVCQGEGTIAEDFKFDPSPYRPVTCRLCNGERRVDGADCPACGGEGQLEARVAEQIDWSSFDKITCRLCNGERRVDGADCPACGGEGRLERRVAEQIDWSSFDKVTCRLCNGERRVDGADCPACGGEGQLERRVAEQIDWSSFDKVTCRLCNGERRWRGEDCPVCHGEGELFRRALETIDLSDYRDVECPLCEGAGKFKNDDCPECFGIGKMEQWRAESVNVSDYQ